MAQLKMDTEYINYPPGQSPWQEQSANTNWTPHFVFIFMRKNMKLVRDKEVGEELWEQEKYKK